MTWINSLRSYLAEHLGPVSQSQASIGLALALLGIWISARSGGRALDVLLLRAGRHGRWRLTPLWFMGLLAGWMNPGRGHRDLDAISLTSTGRVSSLGASWFGMGAAAATGFLALSLLVLDAHRAVPAVLVATLFASLTLAIVERDKGAGAFGGTVAGWSSLLLGAFLVSDQLDNLTGLVDLTPWSQAIDAGVWCAVACVTQIAGMPRGFVIVILPALVFGGVIPLHAALATSAGVHLGRAMSLVLTGENPGSQARSAQLLVQIQAVITGLAALGLLLASLRWLIGTPWAEFHSLEILIAMELGAVFLGTIVWALLGAPIARLVGRRQGEEARPHHSAVSRPSVVVLGAISHAQRAGELAMQLSGRVLVPFSLRNIAGTVQSLHPAGKLSRRAEHLRESLETLVARVDPWERSEEQSHLLAASLRASEERLALIEVLGDARLEPSRHQVTPSEELTPAFDRDLIERARLLKLSIADHGEWAPLDEDLVADLDASMADLRQCLSNELTNKRLDPILHTRLNAQLDARQEFTQRCAHVSEHPLPRLAGGSDDSLQENLQRRLSSGEEDLYLLDEADNRAA